MTDELRKLVEEAVDRLAGCAGEECCDACIKWTERAERALQRSKELPEIAALRAAGQAGAGAFNAQRTAIGLMSETLAAHSDALRDLDGNRITPLETEVRAQGARIADDAQYAKRRLEEHGAANVEIRKRLHDLEEAVRKFTDDPASLDERVAALEGGQGVGTEGARVIAAARRVVDPDANDPAFELAGLEAALAALDAPPAPVERHQPPSGDAPASQGLSALERRVSALEGADGGDLWDAVSAQADTDVQHRSALDAQANGLVDHRKSLDSLHLRAAELEGAVGDSAAARKALTEQVIPACQAVAVAVDAQETRIATLETQVKAASIDRSAIEKRIDFLRDTNLVELARRITALEEAK